MQHDLAGKEPHSGTNQKRNRSLNDCQVIDHSPSQFQSLPKSKSYHQHHQDPTRGIKQSCRNQSTHITTERPSASRLLQ
jgi:hypothetical protein